MSEKKKFNIEDEIDLSKLFSSFLKNKFLILSITSFFSISSIIYSLSMPNQYQASMVIAPISNDSGSIASSIGSSGLGGLASIAGVNLSNDGVSEAKIAIQVMQSWGFIEEFIEKNNIAKYLVASDSWDITNNSMIIDNKIYDVKNDKWLITEPTSWELYKSFSDRLSVQEDLKSGMTTVSFKYFSPTIAKQWVELLVRDINDFMKKRELNKVDKSISYLQEQINNTSIKDMENVFYQIIAEQTKTKMLAEATPEYVFVTISKAMVPEEKSEPTRSIIVIIATIIGFIFSLLISLIKYHKDGFSLQPDKDN